MVIENIKNIPLTFKSLENSSTIKIQRKSADNTEEREFDL